MGSVVEILRDEPGRRHLGTTAWLVTMVFPSRDSNSG
jgi:hypothetical protein